MDLEQLKHRNSADSQTLAQPYQPVVYAIPQAQWKAMLDLMTNNLPGIPALQESVYYLVTQEGLETYYEETSKSLARLTGSLDSHQREMASQVGKMNEQNSRWVRDLEASLKSQSKENQERLWKKLTWILIGQSLYLSALLITLTLILR